MFIRDRFKHTYLIMKKKTVYIAHPISGDVESNIERVLKICKEVHTENIIPVAPYIVSLRYLNDKVTGDRELGIEVNYEYFRRRYVDELWLFGAEISEGMYKEVLLAREMNIPIIPKTAGTLKALDALKTELKYPIGFEHQPLFIEQYINTCFNAVTEYLSVRLYGYLQDDINNFYRKFLIYVSTDLPYVVKTLQQHNIEPISDEAVREITVYITNQLNSSGNKYELLLSELESEYR